MKIRVSYYDEPNDKEVNFDGTIDFNNLNNLEDFDRYVKIEGAVDDYLDTVNIDYGGDNDWYELDVCDFTPGTDLNELCPRILKSVEDALSNKEDDNESV